MINRFSSRMKKLDVSFLNQRLKHAKSYDRIAGYFCSSILEVAGEAIEEMDGVIRIICNSTLDKDDVSTANAAQYSMKREWCESKPELKVVGSNERFKKLYDLLTSKKLLVKVIPNEVFGLMHGKAGVITFSDGSKTSFIGSANETYSSWKLNYEIVWEDDSSEAINWVQSEFDYFWNSPFAVNLCDFIVNDIKRISDREVIKDVGEWKKEANPASVVVESPVYRKELGLWEHQKYFVSLAFEEHKKDCARFILADMVGLGKTIQLALAANLMALYGKRPVLIIVPKTLLWQWQSEIKTLLGIPSAVWTGKVWVDENGIMYPSINENSIKKCPRKIGIISQGLITAGSETVENIKNMDFECVIVDEAHRARRSKFNPGKETSKFDPNNLMKFLIDISSRTKSMILATATPVQLYPIEAWDLLYILAQGSDKVLGNKYSIWRSNPSKVLDLVMGFEEIENYPEEYWEYIRNPFPPSRENEKTFGKIRRGLEISEKNYVIEPEAYVKMRPNYKKRVKMIMEDDFFQRYNPFIRNIIRRERRYLEDTINLETNEPYLKKIKVNLMGEDDNEAILLSPYLKEAYECAERFSELLQKRVKAAGFLKTLLLRRVGSTIIAGKNTAIKMLSHNEIETDEDDSTETMNEKAKSEVLNFSQEEIDELKRFIDILEITKDEDPKYKAVYDLLVKERWIEKGCIIFSQYYDSVYWVGETLSKELNDIKIGLYAGGDRSGVFINGTYSRMTKEDVKNMVRNKEIKVLLGTDAASEGLNLQILGTLINLDLPWNPTRLEQRKGRIQRIGQLYDEIYIYNMRYKDSVEDKVHHMLSKRMESIFTLFGQLPDVLEDVWVKIALNEIEEAEQIIDEVPNKHPFEIRYKMDVENIDWESCSKILDGGEIVKYMMEGW